MTKADKQLIKTLQNIKDSCSHTDDCRYCRFRMDGYCQIREIINELHFNDPICWNMKEIERIITNNDV